MVCWRSATAKLVVEVYNGNSIIGTQEQYVSTAGETAWEELAIGMNLPPNTTSIVAYMKYEGGTEVYFDDLKIELSAVPVAMVVQENHYYPFGLGMKGLDYVAPSPNVENKFQYNGKEKQPELSLNWIDYGARNYDAQIGRWHSIDPLAEQMRRFSTYAYSFNNPIRFKDPDGMMPRENEYLGSAGPADKIKREDILGKMAFEMKQEQHKIAENIQKLSHVSHRKNGKDKASENSRKGKSNKKRDNTTPTEPELSEMFGVSFHQALNRLYEHFYDNPLEDNIGVSEQLLAAKVIEIGDMELKNSSSEESKQWISLRFIGYVLVAGFEHLKNDVNTMGIVSNPSRFTAVVTPSRGQELRVYPPTGRYELVGIVRNPGHNPERDFIKITARDGSFFYVVMAYEVPITH